jgi:NADH:ubiquinone oxidoreductase subunit E
MAECCQGCPTDHRDKDELFQRLDQIIDEHKDKPGALIPVLHEAQMLFGYLPDDVQTHVAEGLNVPLSEVYGVITFYSLFNLKPKGKHTIGVCMGTACYVKGAPAVVKEITNELGINADDTTDDGLFTFTITRCVGACGLAPVMTIDEDVYGRLSADKVPEILAKYKS